MISEHHIIVHLSFTVILFKAHLNSILNSFKKNSYKKNRNFNIDRATGLLEISLYIKFKTGPS
jgi:hypothetical protein